jgi:riboflavin synthase
MFTGIVEETGQVVAFAPGAKAWRLQIAARAALTGVALGDSIAVNGCCLTVAAFDSAHLFFDVLEESRRLTNFSELAVGAPVNLERSLRFDGKVGGLGGGRGQSLTLDSWMRRRVYARVHSPSLALYYRCTKT